MRIGRGKGMRTIPDTFPRARPRTDHAVAPFPNHHFTRVLTPPYGTRSTHMTLAARAVLCRRAWAVSLAATMPLHMVCGADRRRCELRSETLFFSKTRLAGRPVPLYVPGHWGLKFLIFDCKCSGLDMFRIKVQSTRNINPNAKRLSPLAAAEIPARPKPGQYWPRPPSGRGLKFQSKMVLMEPHMMAFNGQCSGLKGTRD